MYKLFYITIFHLLLFIIQLNSRFIDQNNNNDLYYDSYEVNSPLKLMNEISPDSIGVPTNTKGLKMKRARHFNRKKKNRNKNKNETEDDNTNDDSVSHHTNDSEEKNTPESDHTNDDSSNHDIDDSEEKTNSESNSSNESKSKYESTSRVFSPYVDIMLYPTPDLVKIKKSTGIDTFIVSFVVCCNSPGCTSNSASFGGVLGIGSNSEGNNSDLSTINNTIKSFKDDGGNVVISFGGAVNNELALCHDDPQSLAAEYKKVIKEYRPVRIDFDIEGNTGGKDTHQLRAKALSILKKELADEMPLISLCLPVNPDFGLDSSALSVIESMRDENVDIDLISLMTMDYGANYAGIPSSVNAVNALEASYEQSKKYYPNIKMGVIPMVGENDDGSVFSISDAKSLLGEIKQRNYVKMLSMWSINRDKNSGDFTSLVSNTFRNSKFEEDCGGKNKYVYSSIFMNYLK